jgi:nucleoside-diphosphate-sugar epimerase
VKVLVTGAAGFIGRHVTACLVERGHQVTALVFPGKEELLAGQWRRTAGGERSSGRGIPTAGPAAEIVPLNLDDASGLRALVTRVRPEAVIHLAWYAVPGHFWSAPENLDSAAQTLRLARIVGEAGCERLLGAGTCAEYEWSGGRLVENETPSRPRTLYGAAKLAAFTALARYCPEVDVSLAWLRYNFVYGPGEAAGRLVPSVIAGLSAGHDVECTHGRQDRDFMYVTDLAAATVAVLESGIQGVVNIGSGETHSVREVVETLAGLIGGSGRPLFGVRQADSDEPESLIPDVSRLFDQVGWRPCFHLHEGLRNTLERWREDR